MLVVQDGAVLICADQLRSGWHAAPESLKRVCVIADLVVFASQDNCIVGVFIDQEHIVPLGDNQCIRYWNQKKTEEGDAKGEEVCFHDGQAQGHVLSSALRARIVQPNPHEQKPVAFFEGNE